MATKQINLKIPSNLYVTAESFAETYGYRNVQDLALESLREKLFEKNEYDESFSEKEIELIDELIEKSIKKKKFISEEEFLKATQ
ncbi:MAG: hypothetical protein JW703_01335 [Candidatus Diapherotrites archaeon]|nr:hypothetical protein [Candidatus Diapherotrites archaeon]